VTHVSRMMIMAALSAGLVCWAGCKRPSSGEEIPWPEAGEPDEHPVGVPGQDEPGATEESAESGPEAAGEQPASGEGGGDEGAGADAGAAGAGGEEPEDGEEPEGGEEGAGEEPGGKVDKGPGRVVLAPPSGKMGAVSFKHKAHQEMFGCKKCHHEMEPKSTPLACTTCHGADPDAPDVKKAFHNRCKACHNAMGAGPTKCNGCHK